MYKCSFCSNWQDDFNKGRCNVCNAPLEGVVLPEEKYDCYCESGSHVKKNKDSNDIIMRLFGNSAASNVVIFICGFISFFCVPLAVAIAILFVVYKHKKETL